MTDAYYGHENIQESAETGLDNLKAQQNEASAIMTTTLDRQTRINELAELLWERVSDAEKPLVHEVYENVNQMVMDTTRLAVAQEAAGAFAKKMFEYHQKLARNYQEASDEIDALEDEVNNLRDEFTEAMHEAYENIFDELHDNIAQTTGCQDWGVIYRFTDFLVGNLQPTDEQRALLCDLVATFIEAEAVS